MIFVIYILGFFLYQSKVRELKNIKHQKDTEFLTMQINNTILAGRIVDYYHGENRIVKYRTVLEAIIAIDKYLPQFFKSGKYTKKDMLAIAMIESDFGIHKDGAAGEKGLYQILDWKTYSVTIDGINDPYNINCNTYMALRVLKDKTNLHKDKKKSIIAYNGLIYDAEGDLSERYWYKFKKCRDILENF